MRVDMRVCVWEWVCITICCITIHCFIVTYFGNCITMYGITMYGKKIEGDWCGSSNPPREPLRCLPLDAVEPAFQRSDCRLSLDKLE